MSSRGAIKRARIHFSRAFAHVVEHGQVRDAVDCYRKGLAIAPNPADHSDLVLYGMYDDRVTQAQLLEEARSWDRMWAAPLADKIAAHRNDRDPDRRLRIGYLTSHPFEKHAILFAVPVLPHHDRALFEPFVYSSSGPWSHYTPSEAAQHCPAVWRFIEKLDDDAAAELIRSDGIDILVDMCGHLAENRALVLARKPAPIQAFWYAYPGTTGLSTVDYRLTDRFLDPPDGDLSAYSEKSIWLETFWCYDPCLPELGEPRELPFQSSGRITFGSLNQLLKLTDESIDLWAKVMHAVVDSRMILWVYEGQPRARVAAAFRQRDVDPDRIEFVPFQTRGNYMQTHHRIDIALDPIYYGGHTTSLDALWMNVPVVTLVGPTIVGRGGLSILTNAGLPELVARTPEEYVAKAVALASDLPRLAELRAGLRERLRASPLMDAPRFVRNLEAAYRGIWRTWCHEV